MASNGRPVVPWTCPHCQAVWHSGRQYCVDCGYGMSGPAGDRREPRPQWEQRLRSLEPVQAPEEPALEAPDEDRAEALRRALAAESQVRAEYEVVRQRLSQVEVALRESEQARDEERRGWMEGLTQLVAPLRAYLQGQGVDVPLVQMVPEVLKRVAPRPEGRTKGAAAAGAAELTHLTTLVVALQARVRRLEGQAAGAADEDYGTWTVTDQRQAAVEQAMREAEGRGDGRYRG